MQVFESFLAERFGKTITRNAAVIDSVCSPIDNGGQECLVTKVDMYVYFPERFIKANLAKIGDVYSVIGYIAMVTEGGYAVMSMPSMLTMVPASARTIKIDEQDYYELYFMAGTPVLETTKLLKDSTLVYPIYNEFISKPNIPIYFSYEDGLLVIQKAPKYAGLYLERNNVATEIVMATTVRDRNNTSILYRHAVHKDPKAIPQFFGLRNIQMGVTSVPSAIIGSYSDMAIDSIIVNPPKRTDAYEKLVRS